MIMCNQSKTVMREEMKVKVQSLTDNERGQENACICRTLSKRCKDQDNIIGVFMPLQDEPDIEPFIEECFAAGISICTPEWKYPDLTFKIIRSFDDIRKDPKTKIREPKAKNPSVDPSGITHVLVPGRAFTRSGGRLGRGGGAYDRWIREQRMINPATRFIGVCFRCQIVDELPMEMHDEKVDEVVTGS
ncbi:MAG: 5-formyltetrahydrofolate cyclo-ligase [Candidatus Peribacteraceae bacterium]|nr:5-formyltetrahydrofolate cyclo-ligase [Candidatus Peribacteraceae bacterium]